MRGIESIEKFKRMWSIESIEKFKRMWSIESIERSNAMTFKEFVSWCNDRAADGCWGINAATVCISIVNEVRELPFWKREKFWKEKYEEKVICAIVKPIEKKISELRR